MLKRCRAPWVLPLLLVLGACATGVQVSDAELDSRQIHTVQTVDEALSSFLAGLGKCGVSTSTGVFTEVQHGIAECSPPDAGRAVICDIYVGIQLGGSVRRSDVMLGRLRLRPSATGADITIGIQPWAGRRDLVVGAWEQLVRGRAQEVCPQKFGD